MHRLFSPLSGKDFDIPYHSGVELAPIVIITGLSECEGNGRGTQVLTVHHRIFCTLFLKGVTGGCPDRYGLSNLHRETLWAVRLH